MLSYCETLIASHAYLWDIFRISIRKATCRQHLQKERPLKKIFGGENNRPFTFRTSQITFLHDQGSWLVPAPSFLLVPFHFVTITTPYSSKDADLVPSYSSCLKMNRMEGFLDGSRKDLSNPAAAVQSQSSQQAMLKTTGQRSPESCFQYDTNHRSSLHL